MRQQNQCVLDCSVEIMGLSWLVLTTGWTTDRLTSYIWALLGCVQQVTGQIGQTIGMAYVRLLDNFHPYPHGDHSPDNVKFPDISQHSAC